jgi:Rps23 Pro-64 3,4-dihydroxylase Tpa1-like proline 4-hydroxylase
VLDTKAFEARVEDYAREFKAARPFPHLVIDEFLPPETIKTLIATFPQPGEEPWISYRTQREKKFALEDESLMPEAALTVLRDLNGQAFVNFLEKVTGIEGLVPDPHFRGAGLHQIARGGLLKVHADFNLHPRLRLQRRVNALLYLNEDWDPSYGGDLELWDAEMSQAVTKVRPLANRLMIFRTDPGNFHGHPEPLACPEGRYRRSLAWYYYTLPEQDFSLAYDSGHHGRWRSRPGESVYSTRERATSRAIQLVPAPAKRIVRRFRSRAGAGH